MMRNTDVRRALIVRRKAAALRLSGAGRPLHFLHIGKTAGTAIKRAFNAAPPRAILHGHRFALRHLPRGAEHVRRARSAGAVLQRLLQPQARRPSAPGNPWTPKEAEAFALFAHANDLAEAPDGSGAEAAATREVIRAILHVRKPHLGWFEGDPERVFTHHSPLQILRQRHLQTDLTALWTRLGLPDTPHLPNDPVAAHRNDYTGLPQLSDRARRNLSAWYAADIAFVRRAEAWAAARAAGDCGPQDMHIS